VMHELADALEDTHVAAEMLLQKPFSQTALLERVRQLMHH